MLQQCWLLALQPVHRLPLLQPLLLLLLLLRQSLRWMGP
jgi:hypothetical protein